LLLFAEDHYPHDSTAYRGVHQSSQAHWAVLHRGSAFGSAPCLAKRERLARVLGSSCHLFRPLAQRRSM